MPFCSRCHKDWPEQYWVCPEDGTVLTAARAAAGNDPIATPVGIAREEDLRPGTLIGEYRVEGKLGQGGMASVFSATQPLIGKKVAIKVMSRRLCADLHAVERFIGEARTVNQIGHPNLVDIFAFGVLPDGRAYLVMEWLQGDTLADRLARERLPVPRALDVLLQIVDALEAAHDKGVVHRDLKPANIFLVDRRTGNGALAVKLLDFGIAKLADSDPNVPKTRSGVAMGTAGYMSPEQARGKNVDHRTDIYALGCLAYEILLGRLPFVADTAIDILAMHLASAPPAPRTLWAGVPPALDRILLQMLAKEPDGRPSLAQVRAVLEGATRSITPTMGVPALPAPERPRRAWPLAAGLGTLGLIGVGAALWMASRETTATPPPPAMASSTVLPATAAPPPPRPSPPPKPAPAAPKRVERATLVLHVPAGARVRVDGQDYPSACGELRVSVDGGEHRLLVTARGYKPYADQVHVASGALTEMRPTLAPLKPAARAPAPRPAAATERKTNGDYTLDPF